LPIADCQLPIADWRIFRMSDRWKIGIAVVGVILVALLPWIWEVHPVVAYLLLLPLSVWAIWLMVEYLHWAERLGK
jgi:hypothetical protein